MIDWQLLDPGDSRIACPECSRGPKDRTLGVTIKHYGQGVAHCHRCNYIETCRDEQARRRPGAAPQRTITPTKHESLSEYGHALWRACEPRAEVALDYLNSRRCRIPPADGDLRWHPELKHSPSGYIGPALVSLVTDAVTREPMTLHRTWINADGTKAAVDPPRMLLGGHRKQGGVIRLWPDEMVTLGLGIAEGIETALTLAHGYSPVWSLIDAGNLAAFPVLSGIESLVIAADNDIAGNQAAGECARRWANAGREVSIVPADHEGEDVNDEVQRVDAH